MRSHRSGSTVPFTGWRPSSGAIGAFAAGAFAIGAYAIGALAVGRLAIGKARIKVLEIDELSVRRNRGGRSLDQNEVGHSDITMTTARLADEYVSLCRQGEFDEAMRRFFSADHVRLESPDMTGPPIEMRGLEVIQESSRGFAEEQEIHGFNVEGPFVGGRCFAARFSIDATSNSTNSRDTIRKLDLYTVRDGTIVRSEVYYNTPPLSAL